MHPEYLRVFEKISFELIGEQANLFAYSPGFRDLYIRVNKGNRHFLLKFNEVVSAKTSISWRLNKINFEELTSTKDKDLSLFGNYRFYDSHDLEVICGKCYVVELIDGQNVL
jgi:hypothetical protein